ncbi:hypothetical protein NXF25_018846 [Crotalus adamanteus]|uniref:Uncharacterized protein n=1 Tax=Crotalus adamanteus TaxID=8729 RepID=A0AAW1B105_CROAD
MVQILVAMSAR